MGLLKHIRTPISRQSIELLYSSNGVEYEKVVVYGDFINSFIGLVMTTYMGDDVTSEVEQMYHFNWCWNRTKNSFKSEGLDFGKLNKAKKYFMEFMLEFYYNANDKSDTSVAVVKTKELWESSFDYMGEKTRADVDGFLEVYKLFDKSVNAKS